MVRLLVTGAAGLLGSHVLDLIATRRKKVEEAFGERVDFVRVLDVAPEPRNTSSQSELKRLVGVVDEWVAGSVADAGVVDRAVSDVDVVLHLASVVDTGVGDPDLITLVNETGTRTIVEAAVRSRVVKALVYASSVDVLTVGMWQGVDGLNEESCPRVLDLDPPPADAAHHTYTVSKTRAEDAVLAANHARAGLRTAVVRPLGIFGERDPTHMGILLNMAREMGSGNIFAVGSRGSVFQHVYAGNCAWMHILAAGRLLQRDDDVAGQAFMGIDNTKVVNFFEFFFPYMAALGYRIPTWRIPAVVMYALAVPSEAWYWGLKGLGLRPKPIHITRVGVFGSSITQWFDTDKPHRLLGYAPLFTPRESRTRTLNYFLETMPRGAFTYAPGAFDYEDDGVNWRPDHAEYLAERDLAASRALSFWPALRSLYFVLVAVFALVVVVVVAAAEGRSA